MPDKPRGFEDPASCANAFASIFVHYVQTIAVNDREFAAMALAVVRRQILEKLPERRLSARDKASIVGIFDLAEAAIVSEDRPQ